MRDEHPVDRYHALAGKQRCIGRGLPHRESDVLPDPVRLDALVELLRLGQPVKPYRAFRPPFGSRRVGRWAGVTATVLAVPDKGDALHAAASEPPRQIRRQIDHRPRERPGRRVAREDDGERFWQQVREHHLVDLAGGKKGIDSVHVIAVEMRQEQEVELGMAERRDLAQQRVALIGAAIIGPAEPAVVVLKGAREQPPLSDRMLDQLRVHDVPHARSISRGELAINRQLSLRPQLPPFWREVVTGRLNPPAVSPCSMERLPVGGCALARQCSRCGPC